MEVTEAPHVRATRAAQLAAQRRRAAYLEARGWKCQEPGAFKNSEDRLAELLIAANQLRRHIDLDAWRWDKVTEQDKASALELFAWLFPYEECPSIDAVA